ncbi:MAG: type II secretion system protein GspG [Patescibacteria group bacterium]
MSTFFKNRGFTLIEILVSIAILVILAGVILMAYPIMIEKAKVSKARAEIKDIYNAISMLEIDSNEWLGHKMPRIKECGINNNEICSDGCLYNLSDCESGIVCNPPAPNDYFNWKGPYLEEISQDPWGNEYFFDTDYDTEDGCSVVVGSYGPNGIGLNQYDEDDIIYVIPSQ